MRRYPYLPDGSQNRNPSDVSFWSLISEDFITHNRQLFSQGFLTLFVHRFGNWRMSIRLKPLRAPFSILYRLLFKFCEFGCGISLPYNIPVGRRVCLEHFGGMVLIAQSIGSDVTIRQNTTLGLVDKSKPGWPTINDGVDIGVGAVIVGDITIGAGSKIGANAVVLRDVPPKTVAVGVPASVVKTLP